MQITKGEHKICLMYKEYSLTLVYHYNIIAGTVIYSTNTTYCVKGHFNAPVFCCLVDAICGCLNMFTKASKISKKSKNRICLTTIIQDKQLNSYWHVKIKRDKRMHGLDLGISLMFSAGGKLVSQAVKLFELNFFITKTVC